MYADYTYYTGTYKGTMDADTFARVGVHATALIDNMTNGSAATASNITAVKNAQCAICDELLRQELGGDIASESNDGISRTYASGTAKSTVQKITQVAMIYIGDLMYCGV